MDVKWRRANTVIITGRKRVWSGFIKHLSQLPGLLPAGWREERCFHLHLIWFCWSRVAEQPVRPRACTRINATSLHRACPSLHQDQACFLLLWAPVDTHLSGSKTGSSTRTPGKKELQALAAQRDRGISILGHGDSLAPGWDGAGAGALQRSLFSTIRKQPRSSSVKRLGHFCVLSASQ